ncbi:MAG: MFS transporter [Candidatus Micrarchaeaceae archaeon]
MSEEDILQIFDKRPPSSYNYFIITMVNMGYFLDGFSLLVIGPVLIFVGPLFHLSVLMISLVGVATIIGQLVGGAIFGFLADLKGRKVIFQWDMLIFVIFAILSGLSTNVYELIAFRIILGLAIGAEDALSYSIIGEVSPVKKRGKYLGTSLMFWWIGGALAAGISLPLLPYGDLTWRYLLIIGAIPAIIVLIMRRNIVETPRFAKEKKLTDELKKVEEKFNIRINTVSTEAIHPEKKSTPNYKRRAVFTFTSWFLNDLIFYGIGIYTATLLVELGYAGHFGSLFLTLVLYIIGIMGTVAFVFTADSFGRMNWQKYGFLGEGIPLLILAIYFLYTRTAPPLILLFPMFVIFYFANSGGTGETTGIFVSELFPTRIRSTALGAGTAISRVGAIISSVIFPITLKLYGALPMEILLFAIGIAGFLVTQLLGEETMNRSLEETTDYGA